MKPPFFIFRPNRDMTPEHLACAHCHISYTSEVELRLHYQRASCPILLIEWVRDQHSGPSVTTSAPPEAHVSSDTAHLSTICHPTSGRPVLIVNDLRMPADTPAYTSDLTWPLLTTATMSFATASYWHVPFWPELRLRWFHAFANWMAHLHELPQLDLEVSLHHRLLDFCTLVIPCHWARDSEEQELLQYDDIIFHSTAWIQHFHFQSLLYELEHVLAHLTDGTYERRRSVFCRADGSLWKSLCKTSQNGGGGQAIRPPTCTQGTEEALALIGFGLGRRWKLDIHASQVDSSPGGPAESASPRQELHLLCSGRKRQHSATDAEDFQRLAWTEGIRPGHHLTGTTHVPLRVRGTGLSNIEIALRIKRSRIDSSPSEQADIDSNQLLELPSMGSQRESSEAGSPLQRKPQL